MRSYAMCGVIILALQAVLAAQSVVPQMINFQGYLTDNEGNPLHGTFDITFEIYDDSTNGTLLWSEDHDSVLVDSGVFNVLLGSIAEIPEVTFNSANRWLEVTINTPPGQVFPRTRITSVAYAFTDYDWIKNNNGDLYYADGKIGIGIESPTKNLDINGEARVRNELSVNDKIIVATPGSWIPVGYRFVVKGSAYVEDTLKVNGPIKFQFFQFDFDTTVTISSGQTKTIYHNLGGDPSKYIVYMYGIASDGSIHQANYGTNGYGTPVKWLGCEWYGLTSNRIKVSRGDHDYEAASSKDWSQIRIQILKNQ